MVRRKDGPKDIADLRRKRKSWRASSPGSMAPQRLNEIQGVGRFSSRRYCDSCGQKVAACRCKEAA